ncbi:hypothetical protein D9M73_143070 [compost metagenome]
MRSGSGVYARSLVFSTWILAVRESKTLTADSMASGELPCVQAALRFWAPMKNSTLAAGAPLVAA